MTWCTRDRETKQEGLSMECPKCEASMQRVLHQGIEVDRCTQCKGLWFDYLEKDAMRQGRRWIRAARSRAGVSTRFAR